MTVKRYLQAIVEAQAEEMRRDEGVFIIGEDVRSSIMGTTGGLVEEFGERRVVDAPLAELGFTGLAVGAAMAGLRPIVEYCINTLQYLAMEQIVNQAGKLRYMTGGQIDMPLVIRIVGAGGGGGMAAQHSDSTWAQLIHMGVKVIVPSTPADAKGLLKAAIRENDPVVMYEPAVLYASRGEIPEGDHVIPLGVADVKRAGTDVTVVATGHLVRDALTLAEEYGDRGISVEVVDPRTLFPIDKEAILASVRKTGRLLVADDGYRTCGFASEVAAIVAQEAFDALQAPIVRITRPQVPVPYSKIIEMSVLPGKDQLAVGLDQLLGR